MKNFTKAGFLFYEFAQLEDNPALIIYSDNDIHKRIFATITLREEYRDKIDNDLEDAGIALYQIPGTAVWINPAVLLSISSTNNIITLEFPWNVKKELPFATKELMEVTYQDILDHRNISNEDYLTRDEADELYATKEELETKQDTLISGTNIKTINNESLLGEGNLNIEGASIIFRQW